MAATMTYAAVAAASPNAREAVERLNQVLLNAFLPVGLKAKLTDEVVRRYGPEIVQYSGQVLDKANNECRSEMAGFASEKEAFDNINEKEKMSYGIYSTISVETEKWGPRNNHEERGWLKTFLQGIEGDFEVEAGWNTIKAKVTKKAKKHAYRFNLNEDLNKKRIGGLWQDVVELKKSSLIETKSKNKMFSKFLSANKAEFKKREHIVALRKLIVPCKHEELDESQVCCKTEKLRRQLKRRINDFDQKVLNVRHEMIALITARRIEQASIRKYKSEAKTPRYYEVWSKISGFTESVTANDTTTTYRPYMTGSMKAKCRRNAAAYLRGEYEIESPIVQNAFSFLLENRENVEEEIKLTPMPRFYKPRVWQRKRQAPIVRRRKPEKEELSDAEMEEIVNIWANPKSKRESLLQDSTIPNIREKCKRWKQDLARKIENRRIKLAVRKPLVQQKTLLDKVEEAREDQKDYRMKQKWIAYHDKRQKIQKVIEERERKRQAIAEKRKAEWLAIRAEREELKQQRFKEWFERFEREQKRRAKREERRKCLQEVYKRERLDIVEKKAEAPVGKLLFIDSNQYKKLTGNTPSNTVGYCKYIKQKVSTPLTAAKSSTPKDAGGWHLHVCKMCDHTYSHNHKFRGPHVQFEFQCPRPTCPWFFRKGDEIQGLNRTRSRFINFDEWDAEPVDIIPHMDKDQKAEKLPMPENWKGDDHIYYQEEGKEIEVMTVHPNPKNALFAGTTSDIYHTKPFAELTHKVYLGSPIGDAVIVKDDTLESIYSVNDKTFRRKSRYFEFVKKRNLKSGTPIFNENGELCSVVTYSYDGTRYVLMTDADYCVDITPPEVIKKMPDGWKEDTRVFFNRKPPGSTRRYAFVSIDMPIISENHEPIVTNVKMSELSATVTVGDPESSPVKVVQERESFEYTIGTRRIHRKCRYIETIETYKIGTPLWNEEGNLCSMIVNESSDRKYFILSDDDPKQEVVGKKSVEYPNGWSFDGRKVKYSSGGKYCEVMHNENEFYIRDVNTNMEFHKVTKRCRIFNDRGPLVDVEDIGVVEGTRWSLNTEVQQKSFTFDHNIVSGTPIFNWDNQLCGVITSSVGGRYAVGRPDSIFIKSRSEDIVYANVSLNLREQANHHYCGYTSPLILQGNSDIIEYANIRYKTEKGAIMLTRYEKFCRVELGRWFIPDSNVLRGAPIYNQEGNTIIAFSSLTKGRKMAISNYSNNSFSFDHKGMPMQFLNKGNYKVFYKGILYMEKEDVDVQKFQPGLFLLRKEDGIQLQQVDNSGNIVFNLHLEGEYFNETYQEINAQKYHSFAGKILFTTLLSGVIAIPSTGVTRKYRIPTAATTLLKGFDQLNKEVSTAELSVDDLNSKLLGSLPHTFEVTPVSARKIAYKDVNGVMQNIFLTEEKIKENYEQLRQLKDLIVWLKREYGNLNYDGIVGSYNATRDDLEVKKEQLRKMKIEVAAAQLQLNEVIAKLKVMNQQLRTANTMLVMLIRDLADTTDELQSIVNHFEESQSDEPDYSNLSVETATSLEADISKQISEKNLLLEKVHRMTKRQNPVHETITTEPSTTETPSQIFSIVAKPKDFYCGEQWTWNGKCATNSKATVCANNEHQGYQLRFGRIENVECVCEELSKYFIGHLKLTSIGCFKTHHHNCRIGDHHCIGDAHKNVTVQNLYKDYHFTMPSISAAFWYALCLLGAFFSFGYKGGICGIIFIVALIAHPANAFNCGVDGNIYKVQKQENELWKAVGNWKTGDCLHFGNNTLLISNITAKQAYTNVDSLVTTWEFDAYSKTGCVGGAGSSICEQHPNCEGSADYHYDVCTNAYDSAWDNNSCAFGGTFYMSNRICVNSSSEAKLFEKTKEGTKIIIQLEEIDADGNITYTADSINQNNDNIKIEHLIMLVVDLPKNLIQYKNKLYIVQDSTILNDVCTCNLKGSCIPIEENCKKADVVQNRHSIQVTNHPTKWMAAVGTSRLEEMSNQEYFDFNRLIMSLPVESFAADIVVKGKIFSTTLSSCNHLTVRDVTKNEGETKNYKHAIVEVKFAETDCLTTIICDNCLISSSSRQRIKNNKVEFYLLCGIYSSTNCTFLMKNGNVSISIDGISRNPTLAMNYVYNTAKFTVASYMNTTILSTIGSYVMSAYNTINSYFSGKLWKIISWVLFGVGVWFTLQFALEGHYYVSALLILISAVPFAVSEPVCVRWESDCGGLEIPKELCVNNTQHKIHGLWNLYKIGDLLCNRHEAAMYVHKKGINWIDPVEEYCKHGAHFGYSVAEYFELASTVCSGRFQYAHQCRYSKSANCNILQQTSTYQISEIGCVGNCYTSSSTSVRQFTLVLVVSAMIALQCNGVLIGIVFFFMDGITLLGSLLGKVGSVTEAWIDKIRGSTDSIINYSGLIENVGITLACLAVNRWFLLFFCIKYFDDLWEKVFNASSEYQTTTNGATVSPAQTVALKLWPKKKELIEQDNVAYAVRCEGQKDIIFHCGNATKVRMSFLVEEALKNKTDRVNIEVNHPATGDRIFYFSFFKPDIICAPEHAVYNDLDSTVVFKINDLLVYTKSPVGAQEIYDVMKQSECINYSKLPTNFKPGDSGRIFKVDSDKVYIHSGVLKNGAPVCCFCGTQTLFHDDDKPETTITAVTRETRKVTGKFDLSRLSLEEKILKKKKVSVVKKESVSIKDIKDLKVKTVEDKKHGVKLTTLNGYVTPRLNAPTVTISEKELEKDKLAHKMRLKRALNKERIDPLANWCRKIYGESEFNVIINKKISDSFFENIRQHPDSELLDKLFEACKKEAKLIKVNLGETANATRAFKIECISKINSATKAAAVANKHEKYISVEKNIAMKPKINVPGTSGKLTVIVDKNPLVVPRDKLVTVKVTKNDAIKYHSALYDQHDQPETDMEMAVRILKTDNPHKVDTWLFLLGRLLHNNFKYHLTYKKHVKDNAMKFIKKHEQSDWLKLIDENLKFSFILEATDTDEIMALAKEQFYQKEIQEAFNEADMEDKSPVLTMAYYFKFLFDTKTIDIEKLKEETKDRAESFYESILGLIERGEAMARKVASEESSEVDINDLPDEDVGSEYTEEPERTDIRIFTETTNFSNDLRTVLENKGKRLVEMNMYPCPEGGVEVPSVHMVDAWINDRDRTYVFTLEGPSRGHGFFYGGAGYTCHHVTLANDIRVRYYSDQSGMRLLTRTTDATMKNIRLPYTSFLELKRGDMVRYNVVPNPAKFDSPKTGEIYVCVDVRNKQYHTLRWKGTVTTKGGIKNNLFVHVDITKDVDDQTIPFQTKLKGVSGTPILNCKGRPVGIWGTSIITKDRDEEVEVSISRADVGMGEKTELLVVEADNIIRQYNDCKKTGRFLRIQAATGSGKSTKLVLALSMALQKNLKREDFECYVLVPQRDAAMRLYEYMSDFVQRQQLENKVAIQCEHGLTPGTLSSFRGVGGKPKVRITYKTYGSAVNAAKVLQSDLIIMDEIHTRNNAQLLAFEALVDEKKLTNVIALTATPYRAMTQNFLDMTIPAKTPFSIEEFVLASYKTDSGDIEIKDFKRQVSYGISKDEVKEARRILVFHATESQCERQKKNLIDQGQVAIMYTSRFKQDIPAICFICATDVAESSVTIEDVSHVIDLMSHNRPVISLTIENELDLSYRFDQSVIDANSQTQRKGRTGRTCKGKYFCAPGIVVGPFDLYPFAASIEAGLLLQLSDLEYNSDDCESNVLPIKWFNLLNPRDRKFRGIMKLRKDSDAEFEVTMKTRVSDMKNCHAIPAIVFYCSKLLPKIVRDFPDVFGGEDNFLRTWEPSQFVENNDLGTLLGNEGIRITSKLHLLCENRELWEEEDITREWLRKQLDLAKATPELINVNSSDWSSGLAGGLFLVGLGSYAFKYFKDRSCAERKTGEILSIACKKEYDNTIWEALTNFAYCDREYHLDKHDKIYERASSVLGFFKEKLSNLVGNLIKACGPKELQDMWDSQEWRVNADQDWMNIVEGWLTTVIDKVNEFDISMIENLGILSAFPAIGLFFQLCASKYGELVTTAFTSIFAVWAQSVLGNQMYIVTAGAALITNLISTSIFLDPDSTDYSPSLCMALAIVPIVYTGFKKLVNNETVIERVTNHSREIIKEVPAIATQTVSIAKRMTCGTGGADSGYELAIMISNVYREGAGNTWGEKAEALATAFFRFYNVGEMTLNGWITFGVAMTADMIIEWFIDHINNIQIYESSSIRSQTIADKIYANIRDYRTSKTENLRKIYRVAKIITGGLINPWKVPFAAISVVLELLKLRAIGNAMNISYFDEFLRLSERQIFMSPLVSAVGMISIGFQLTNIGHNWNNSLDGAADVARNLIFGNNRQASENFNLNSDEGFWFIVTRSLSQWWDTMKGAFSRIRIGSVISMIAVVLRAVGKMITNIVASCSRVIGAAKDMMRNAFIEMLPNCIQNCIAKNINLANKDVPQVSQTDTDCVIKHLNKYGLKSIRDYILARLSKEVHYNPLNSWFGDGDMCNYVYYRTLLNNEIFINPTRLSSDLNNIKLEGMSNIYIIDNMDAKRLALHAAMHKHRTTYSTAANALNENKNTEILVNTTIVDSDMYILYHNIDKHSYYLVLIPCMGRNMEAQTFVLTNMNVGGKGEGFDKASVYMRQIMMELNCRSSLGTRCDWIFDNENLFRRRAVCKALARILPSDVLSQNFERIIRVLTEDSFMCHIFEKKTLTESVTAALTLFDVNAEWYSSELLWSRVPVSLDFMTHLVEAQPPTAGTYVTFDVLESLCSHDTMDGLQELVWRVTNTSMKIEDLITALNVSLGMDIYYEKSDKTYICSNYYTRCMGNCHVIFTQGKPKQYVGSCRTIKPAPVKLNVGRVRFVNWIAESVENCVNKFDNLKSVHLMNGMPTSTGIEKIELEWKKIGSAPEDLTDIMNLNIVQYTAPVRGDYLHYKTLEQQGSSFLCLEELLKPDLTAGPMLWDCERYHGRPLSIQHVRTICSNGLRNFDTGIIAYWEQDGNGFNFIDRMYAVALEAICCQPYGLHIIRIGKYAATERIKTAVSRSLVMDPVNLCSQGYVDLEFIDKPSADLQPTEKKHATIRIKQLDTPDLENIIKDNAFTVAVTMPDGNVRLIQNAEVTSIKPQKILSCILQTEHQRVVIKSLHPKFKYFLSKKEKQMLAEIKLTKAGKILQSRLKYTALPTIEHVPPPGNLDMRTFTQKIGSFLSKRVEDRPQPVASTSQEMSSDEEEVLFEINTNSKDCGLVTFFKNCFGNKNLVNVERLCLLKEDGLIAQENASRKITRPVADAIVKLASTDSFEDTLRLNFIVHFDRVSTRRLVGDWDKKLKSEVHLHPQEHEKIPLGNPVDWLISTTAVSEPIELKDDYHKRQQITNSLSGVLTGHVWEVAKRWRRVYLPKNADLGTPSKGYMKASMLDRDTGLLFKSRRVLDLSSGAGGFAYYLASLPGDHTRMYNFTTLTRPNHVNFSADAVEAILQKNNNKKFFYNKLNHGNGDFRYQGIYDLAKRNCPMGYDTLIIDCGEANTSHEKESNWMWTEHTIMNKKTEKVLSTKPFEAIEKYIDLVNPGGAMIMKCMGFEKGTLKIMQRMSTRFSKMCFYKMPTSSYVSREFYVIAIGKNTKVTEPWPNIEKVLGHMKFMWLVRAQDFKAWAHKTKKAFKKDLHEYGSEGFGLGLQTKSKTKQDIEREHGYVDSHSHSCESCGDFYVHNHPYDSKDHRHTFTCPNKTCDYYFLKKYKTNHLNAIPANFNWKAQRVSIKRRPIVPCYTYNWRLPDQGWIFIGPKEIEDTMMQKTIKAAGTFPFPEKWTQFGETFEPKMPERWEKLRQQIIKSGYHVLPPSQMFEKIHECGRVSFKEKYGQEKHTQNVLIGDQMFNIYGLTPSSSVIGHTQCTKEYLHSAHKKRLDIWPSEPSQSDADMLLQASIANCTPEYWEIANGPESKKFKIWSYDETCSHINNQGAGGHFDTYCKFKDAVASPEFKKEVMQRLSDLYQGKPVSSYQTCRDKRETKAKKEISGEGRLLIDEAIDPNSKVYKMLNSDEKKVRRAKRLEVLKQSTKISPRNIRYAEFVQRFVDLMILGPYQQHHNNIAKMYMGSTTGTPLWKLGDLVRGVYECYANIEEQELLLGDKIIEENRKLFSKDFLNEFDQRNIKIKLYSDQHSKNKWEEIRKVKKCLIASGDFSGWDGTVTNTDHTIEFIHMKRVYQTRYHELLRHRMELYMFSFTITDNGHILAGWAQRGSGDQLTSSGNTYHNDNIHVAAIAAGTGKTAAEVCRIIGEVHYRVDFSDKPHWKKYYLREMSNIADGDDNNHFAVPNLIQLLDKNGSQFIERCGKKIRCGAKTGYNISETFDGLSFCSHNFKRVRKQVNNGKMPIGMLPVDQRPKRWGEVGFGDGLMAKTHEIVDTYIKQYNLDNAKKWTLVHQRIYDALNDLTVLYLPNRNVPEIVGKYTYTIKNEVLNFDINRVYGNSTKDAKKAAANERAIEITRGKTLAYLLNYIHIETVRAHCAATLSCIGDGTCNMSQLSKRFNIPSTIGSFLSAMGSVFNIRDIRQIETLPRSLDRQGLRTIQENTRMIFETLKIDTSGTEPLKVCPTDVMDLRDKLKVWAYNYCERHQVKMDDVLFEMVSPHPQNTAQKTLLPRPRQLIKKGTLLGSWLTLMSIFSIFDREITVISSPNLKEVKQYTGLTDTELNNVIKKTVKPGEIIQIKHRSRQITVFVIDKTLSAAKYRSKLEYCLLRGEIPNKVATNKYSLSFTPAFVKKTGVKLV